MEALRSMRHSRDMLTDRSTDTESRRTLEASVRIATSILAGMLSVLASA